MLMSFALSATATQKADYSSYYKSARRFRRFARTLITRTRVVKVSEEIANHLPQLGRFGLSIRLATWRWRV